MVNPDAVSHAGYHAGVVVTSTATTGSATWWILDQIVQHGPSWSLVPPLMLGMASLAGAYWSSRKMRLDLAIAQSKADQERRHQEELHRLRMERVKLCVEQMGL